MSTAFDESERATRHAAAALFEGLDETARRAGIREAEVALSGSGAITNWLWEQQPGSTFYVTGAQTADPSRLP